MVKYVPLSRQKHGDKSWKRPDNYYFVSNVSLAPVVGLELAAAAINLPLAFVEDAGSYHLVALLSLTSNTNLLVNEQGKWVGSFIPAIFRSQPFRLLRLEGQERMAVCIDEESDLIGDAKGSEIFFDSEGHPSQSVNAIAQFLQQVNRSHEGTMFAVSALAEAGGIVPWPITLKSGDTELPVQGLFRVDEHVLNSLSDEAFGKLRKAGAVSVAYAQMLSMGRLDMLQKLELARGAQQAKAAMSGTVNLDFLYASADDTLKF